MFTDKIIKWLVLFIFAILVSSAYSQEDELLSEKSRYKISSWAFLGSPFRLPGTNIPVKKWKFHKLDYVENLDSGKVLIDGKYDFRHSLRTWYWGKSAKKVDVVFDLGGKCKLSKILAYAMKNKNLGYTINSLTIYIKVTENEKWREIGKLTNNALLTPEKKRPNTFIFEKDKIDMDARYVKLAFQSARSTAFLVGEVKIFGKRLEPSAFKDKYGLVRTTNRKIKPEWTEIPKFADGIEKIKDPAITCSLTEKVIYRGKTETKSDLPGGKVLDGDRKTGAVVTKNDKMYVFKQLTVIIDLKKQYDVKRVIIWSSGHNDKKYKSFINCYSIAVKDRLWTPVFNKIDNPFWPGESINNQDCYPIISPEINKTTRFLRIDVHADGREANRMQIGEIDIYGKAVK